jgi:hypothetical protein
LVVLAVLCPCSSGADSQRAARFDKDIQPILAEYCYDCHGDGMNKGQVSFDEFKSHEERLGRRDLWRAVLKNVRAGLMPPEKKPRPSAPELRRLEAWIKGEVFGIDPQHPDPGRVTIRRLNRVEYRNTIRDLMGFDFKAGEEFPPDDTGYGFDNIGDVLTVSPLLLEKYMQAAETIVAAAVPTVAKVVGETSLAGKEFRAAEGKLTGERLSFYKEATVAGAFQAVRAGAYRLRLEVEVAGEFDFDPGRCTVVFKVDDRERWRKELAWQNNKRFQFDFEEKWPAGEHRMVFELQPLTPLEQKKNSLDLRIIAVRVQGPLDKRHWTRTKNYDRFFPREEPPASKAARRQYAREVLGQFTRKAFRRPIDDATLARLVTLAEEVYSQPGKRFEEGVAQAMVAVLASPRFLFRVEEGELPSLAQARAPGISKASSSFQKRTKGIPLSPGVRASGWAESPSPLTPTIASLIDEYSLASRLSYFLWSTMPDEELFALAERGELRQGLASQVKRMLADSRADELVRNFVGQWLQARDVEGIDINARIVLARDAGAEKELERRRREFREQREREAQQNLKLTPEQQRERQRQAERRRQFNRPAVELDGPLRQAMRRETEMCFDYVLREDRSVLELIESDYTFLNERLARHYGIPDVPGNEMRRVTLPKDSPRGGVLTHGAILTVTSNPTRTSPVKRGLFILDNLLGTPPPPPPANVPDLEESEREFKDHEPTLREVLALHRGKPLCSSCHNRMDPLGLALENFNALGMWREKERGQPIESAGKLITGESFQDIRGLKGLLANERRLDFYRCLTEKLLTYALGRGLEDYDTHTVDAIVERLDQEQGRSSALLLGIIESAPFQKRRNNPLATAVESTPPERARKARLKPVAISGRIGDVK